MGKTWVAYFMKWAIPCMKNKLPCIEVFYCFNVTVNTISHVFSYFYVCMYVILYLLQINTIFSDYDLQFTAYCLIYQHCHKICAKPLLPNNPIVTTSQDLCL